jgi:hypothetical protein
MFDSARSILGKYIDTDKVSRFTFYSIETERGENPEDLYYLCTIKDRYYVVFETDYIMNTLADVAQEATEIFKGCDLSPLHWIVKKDSQASVGAPTVPVDASNADKFRGSLVSDKEGSSSSYAVKHAVIEFADIKNRKQHRFHPNTYGKVS